MAAHLAARHGASVDAAPFGPVLRGMVFTGGEPRFMRSGVPGDDPDIPVASYPLWWPPTKIAGRYLAPVALETRSGLSRARRRARGTSPGDPVAVESEVGGPGQRVGEPVLSCSPSMLAVTITSP